jgi:hypothetical protein
MAPYHSSLFDRAFILYDFRNPEKNKPNDSVSVPPRTLAGSGYTGHVVIRPRALNFRLRGGCGDDDKAPKQDHVIETRFA